MQQVDIVIAGGGLSGLYATWLLEQKGINNFVLLEARADLGGRIRSFKPAGDAACFDLGPAWYWPDYQPQLDRLIGKLGLHSFAQHEQGEMVVERTPGAAPQRLPGYANAPPSRRLQGGMEALIEALRAGVDPARIVTGQKVTQASKHASFIDISSAGTDGAIHTWRARQLLLAIPPRLVEGSIQFSPALPVQLSRQWRNTATWMAPHAKYLAVYERPFWRDQGLSGEARSAVGVLGEIHDASLPDGRAALFGFFRLPAQVRARAGETVLRDHCRAQLGRLFGPQAATPVADAIQDWAFDALTATAQDQNVEAQHPAPPQAAAQEGEWRGCLTGIASEWSPQFPGYLAGAIDAAARAVDALGHMAARP